MDNNCHSADNYPTEQFGPAGGQPPAGGPGSGGHLPQGGRPRRGGHPIRWAAGVAAAAVLIGGAAALAASAGSSSAASTADLAATSEGTASQAAALSAVLSSAGSPASASQDAALPAPGVTAAPGTAAGHRCATGAADLRAAGHPRLARRAAAVCRGRLGRLRLLIRGEHGQVTYRAKDGTSKTLAFERGKVTGVTGTAVTVQAADGTTWTWHLVSDSVVRQDSRKVSGSSLAVGQQVFAGGPVVNGTDDARLIVIRPATAPAATPSASSS
jgi:hypothetical protein